MRRGSLPDGTRGFDTNATVSSADARRFFSAGYRFTVRYVRRVDAHPSDITGAELAGLLGNGLGVMLVQHVAPQGWRPTAALGARYGSTAARHAAEAGYPDGVHLWCDLEGVARGVAAARVVGYCNAWYDAVAAAGFLPALYVGDSCGLHAAQLFHALRFPAFWSAYNLNADDYPARRGVMMRQLPYPPPSRRVEGIPYQYDEDVISADAFRSTPILVLPSDPG